MCDCPKFNAKDLATHLRMLRDGVILAHKLALECTGVIKSDLFYEMREIYVDYDKKDRQGLAYLIDSIELAPKMFDAIEAFWKEQQNKRHHKKMFLSEPSFLSMCEYMIEFRDARSNYG